jgi:hypothetical protein
MRLWHEAQTRKTFAAFVLQNEANCCLCPFRRDLPFHIDTGEIDEAAL